MMPCRVLISARAFCSSRSPAPASCSAFFRSLMSRNAVTDAVMLPFSRRGMEITETGKTDPSLLTNTRCGTGSALPS